MSFIDNRTGPGVDQADRQAKPTDRNITPVVQSISADERAQHQGHRGAVFWMTGLSGSGKSTLSMALQRELFRRGLAAYVLDGDNIRSGLNKDLGFAPADRSENLRRVAEVGKLFADAGMIVISAFISPTELDREMARKIIGDDFREVFVNADLATCEARDVKGLYAKARKGVIPEFTGVSAPWEPPPHADVVIDTARPLEDSVQQLLDYVLEIVRYDAVAGD